MMDTTMTMKGMTMETQKHRRANDGRRTATTMSINLAFFMFTHTQTRARPSWW